MNAARNVQALVRIQLVRTSSSMAFALNPLSKRSCIGICKSAVDSQITAKRTTAIHAVADDTAGMRHSPRSKVMALINSASINGPTTQPVRC